MKKIPRHFYLYLITFSVLTANGFAAAPAAVKPKAPVVKGTKEEGKDTPNDPNAKAAAAAPAAAQPAEEVKKDDAKHVDFGAKDVWDKNLFERDDNKVLVIQDRKYNKAKRLELGLDLGLTSATAFYNSYTFGARAAYYFNEYWGIQAFGNYSINTDTEEKKQLDGYLYDSGFVSSKEFKQPKLFTGIGVVWSPIYGKFAWFRSRIIHFDIYGGLGVSYLTTHSTFNASKVGATRDGTDDSAFGSLENIGLRIFISKSLAWTTEVRNNIYQAKYAETVSGGGGSTIDAKKVWQNNFQFVTGVSYMFNLGGY